MTKRADGKFERRERDFYPTPMDAVEPLLRFLKPKTRFIEYCAGDGRLIDHLTMHGHECVEAFDIEPQRDDIRQGNALHHRYTHGGDVQYISNPPWERELLHALIMHLSRRATLWILLDADWMHTVQAGPFEHRCREIISIGRVKWIEDSDNTGFDNAVWMRFTEPRLEPAIFRFRGPNVFPFL